MSQAFTSDTLQDLLTLDESGKMLKELICDYEKFSIKSILELESSLKTADYRNIAFVAHALKSSSAVLGMQQMREACASLEKAAQEETLLPELIEKLRDYQRLALEAMRSYIDLN